MDHLIPVPGPNGATLRLPASDLVELERGNFHEVVDRLYVLFPRWVTSRTIHRLLGVHPKDLEWGIGQGIFEESKHYKRKGVQRRWNVRRVALTYPLFRKRLLRDRY